MSYDKLLEEIAEKGKNPYTWGEIKPLICYKANTVLEDFYTKNMDMESKEAFNKRLKEVLEPLSHFIET